MISHRSAVEGGPKDGHIVLTYKYTKKITLPGITVHLVAGASNLDGDMPFAAGLFLASPERAWLDNFRTTRAHGFRRTLLPGHMEELLDDYIRHFGEEVFRSKIAALHKLAKRQKLRKEADRFQKIASALLGTRTHKLKTERGRGRALGLPFDPERIQRFEKLFQSLHTGTNSPPTLKITKVITSGGALANFCFFDAYFSNFIEGTRFEVEEARSIVYEGKIPLQRPDGHDVLATFQTLHSMGQGHNTGWKNIDELIVAIKRYHAAIMKAHADKLPGEFKKERNYAGSTAFVDPKLVEGTLKRGLEYFYSLSNGFARAAFAKFLIAEVHPFTDGNGRLSRIVMNEQFYAAGEVPIIIPTVFRPDYLGAIKKLTKTDDPSAYIRMLSKAQRFTASLDYTSFETARLGLIKARAFSDNPEDILDF